MTSSPPMQPNKPCKRQTDGCHHHDQAAGKTSFARRPASRGTRRFWGRGRRTGKRRPRNPRRRGSHCRSEAQIEHDLAATIPQASPPQRPGLRYGLFHLSKALARRKSGVQDWLAVPWGRDKEGVLLNPISESGNSLETPDGLRCIQKFSPSATIRWPGCRIKTSGLRTVSSYGAAASFVD
jgi:hypothetical protein